MEDPTKPQDVTKRSYSATPEAMQQLQSGEGDLGSGTFGQQFNKGLKQAGNYDALERSNIQAGGGVVYDSNPEDEYQETINKASALMAAAEDSYKYN